MTSYTVVPNGGGGFAVEVQHPDGKTQLITGFKTEAEAQAWMVERQREEEAAKTPNSNRPPSG